MGELHDQRHDRSGACCAVGGREAASGLETVVAVGEYDGGRVDERLDGGDAFGLGDGSKVVAHAVVVDAGHGHGGGEQVTQAGGGGEPPDRVEVGAGGGEQGEAVALGLGEGALVREDSRLGWLPDLEGAEHAAGSALGAVGVGGGHRVAVEGGRVVEAQNPGVAPQRQVRRSMSVGVVTGGEDQADRVVGIAGGEVVAQVLVDHVVGWCDHRIEFGAECREVVTQSPEGAELGHGCSFGVRSSGVLAQG